MVTTLPRLDPDAVQTGQAFGEALGLAVVVGEAFDHGLQGDDPGRCRESRRSPTTAEQMPYSHRLGDKVAGPGEDGAEGGAETLVQAQGDGVGHRRQLPGRDAQRHGGIENPRPVQVNRDADLSRYVPDPLHGFGEDDGAAEMGMSVLDPDQTGRGDPAAASAGRA